MSIIMPREFPHLGPPAPLKPAVWPCKGRADWRYPDYRAFIAAWLGVLVGLSLRDLRPSLSPRQRG
jgi:hypothetical protein